VVKIAGSPDFGCNSLSRIVGPEHIGDLASVTRTAVKGRD